MTTMDVYTLCNKKRWYTRGTNKEYERMFELVRNKAPLMDIAFDIFDHSDRDSAPTVGAVYQALEEILERE